MSQMQPEVISKLINFLDDQSMEPLTGCRQNQTESQSEQAIQQNIISHSATVKQTVSHPSK